MEGPLRSPGLRRGPVTLSQSQRHLGGGSSRRRICLWVPRRRMVDQQSGLGLHCTRRREFGVLLRSGLLPPHPCGPRRPGVAPPACGRTACSQRAGFPPRTLSALEVWPSSGPPCGPQRSRLGPGPWCSLCPICRSRRVGGETTARVLPMARKAVQSQQDVCGGDRACPGPVPPDRRSVTRCSVLLTDVPTGVTWGLKL